MGLLRMSSDHPGGDAPTMLTLMYKPWHDGQLVISLLQSVPENHSLSGDKFTHMLSVFVKSIKLFFLEKKKKLPAAELYFTAGILILE